MVGVKKCSNFVALEVRVLELKAQLQTVEKPEDRVGSLDSRELTRTEPPHDPPTETKQPGPQAAWVMVYEGIVPEPSPLVTTNQSMFLGHFP